LAKKEEKSEKREWGSREEDVLAEAQRRRDRKGL
jgi:hypothetical protein